MQYHETRKHEGLRPVALGLIAVLAGACAQENTDGAQPEGAAAGETVRQQAEAEPAAPAAKVIDGSPAQLTTGFDLTHVGRRLETESAPGDGGWVDPTFDEEAGPVQGPEPAPLAAARSAGRLAVESDADRVHDFGEMIQGEHGTHVFELASQGPEDLVIERIKPSCGCTIASTTLAGPDGEVEYVVGQPIPAGTKIRVHAELKTEGKMGDVSSTVSVYSTDPEGVLNLTLRAHVTPVLVAENPLIDFGRTTVADVVTGETVVKSDVLEPFLLQLDQEFVPEPLKVRIEPIDPDAEGKSRQWKVVATLGPQIPEGMRNFPIRLYTDIQGAVADDAPEQHEDHEHAAPKQHEVRLYARAQVTGIVSADRSFLSFGLVRPGQELERSTRIQCFDDFTLDPEMAITVKGLRGEDFPFADSIGYALRPTEEPGVLELVLTLYGMPEDFQGSFGGVVELAVGHPMKPTLEVRFTGVCRIGLPGENPVSVQPSAGGDQGDPGGERE